MCGHVSKIKKDKETFRSSVKDVDRSMRLSFVLVTGNNRIFTSKSS